MARRARLSLVGGVFHVVSRFSRDEWRLDVAGAREAYLDYLGHAATTGGVEVLAYCLMSNHVHLVVVQGERPLERFTKSLHTGFSGWSHRHARGRKAQGPVFAGRPRSVLVDKDAYLLELVRYVHNNPVRAGVARFARSSDWSSHQAYVGRVDAPKWLRIGDVLSQFGSRTRRAAERFDAFVDEGRAEERRPELSGTSSRADLALVHAALGNGHRLSDGIVGSDAFVARVRGKGKRVADALSRRGSERRAGAVGRPTVRQVIDAVLRYKHVDAIELSERPRSRNSAGVKRLAIWMWVHEYEGKQIEVARALGLDTGVASHYYRQAVAAAGDFDQEATAVTAMIEARRGTKKTGKVTPATADAIRVRYHVDVDET
jgi:REP element-mobilizing transposase RayT